ncbi:FAD-binding oxidoreductase [Gymnodinialimonas sp. 2305UL16-5]|uniref:NAD(P)/FAD-dependent oxidoreductase n=1 Tax=Gymnodinialimonas mytili TaxID=3126503 RepID=UPI0030A3C145
MSALYRNDKPGQHAPSWYAASVPERPLRPKLTADARADVVILGAGFTGLWAAKILAEAGLRVVVLEAHRVGFGASGRNGGQVIPGYNWDMSALHARLGDKAAHDLWDLSQSGLAQLKEVCARHPDTAFRTGWAQAEPHVSDFAAYPAEAAFLATTFDHHVEILGTKAFRDLVKTEDYVGGWYDRSGGHLHPLAYTHALATEAEAAGAVIHERSEVLEIRPGAPVQLRCLRGTVTADHAILAGNGYLPGLMPPVNRRVMPMNSFIAVTEPLPDLWLDVLAEDIAISDERFVVNYFRFTADRRFLFGGLESYGLGFPRQIEQPLKAKIARMFPQLAAARIDHAWGGTLAITPTRLPHVARVGQNVISAAGFSGLGVSLSGVAGRVMAEAVLGQAKGLTTLDALPVPSFPGGTAFRAPILALAMSWFALRDRLGV